MNRSKTAKTAELKRFLPALQKQITRDFERAWGWGANLKLNAKKFDMKLVIRDHARGGDLGYHIEGGKPVAYVYAKDAKDAEGEYTSTLSHELLEMIADPNVNLYGAGKFRLKGKLHVGFYAFEVCDPVQENYYHIHGVRVQDFVRPEWFEADHQPGAMKMNFMKTLDAPFELATGGYMEVFANRRWHSLTGPQAKPKRRRHRLQLRMSLLK
ncbi:MAG TPA: hypothetical protein VE863_19440 [Pyrinomonadaceae bacterium]|nr:hypothetical protein [Pyrinomonadaceae bacterium]